jgi:hypothetical protein
VKSIYISGPIKDDPDYLAKFAKAEFVLATGGWKVVNPCTLTSEQLTYAEYMKLDLVAELACDAIFMLQGWEQSGGARCEHLVAAMTGMEIHYQ